MQDAATLEIISGKIETKKDEELFQIDVTGNVKAKKGIKGIKKPPRWDEILKPQSAVVVPKSFTKKANYAETRKGLSRRSTRRAKKDVPLDYDLWKEEPVNQKIMQQFSFIEDVIKPKKVKTPESVGAKLVDAPAVIIADPGASYMPREEDRRRLVIKEAEIEAKIQARHQKIINQLSYSEQTANLNGSDTLPLEDDEEEEEGEEKVAEVVGKAKEKRKKLKRKRKPNLREKLQRAQKKQRIFAKQIEMAPIISRTIANLRKKQEKAALKRRRIRESLKTKPRKRIGKNYVPRERVFVKLSNEKIQSLRQLKPEGNLFLDRYRSITSRNLVEP